MSWGFGAKKHGWMDGWIVEASQVFPHWDVRSCQFLYLSLSVSLSVPSSGWGGRSAWKRTWKYEDVIPRDQFFIYFLDIFSEVVSTPLISCLHLNRYKLPRRPAYSLSELINSYTFLFIMLILFFSIILLLYLRLIFFLVNL